MNISEIDALMARYNGPCVYIAGRYSGVDYNEIDRNIAAAREIATALGLAGVDYICPHMHSQHMEAVAPEIPYTYWINLDLRMMVHCCNAIIMVPGWETSSGARGEHRLAERMGWPIFFDVEDAVSWAAGERQTAAINAIVADHYEVKTGEVS